MIIHDEMRFRIVVAASSRLGQDLSGKTPEELEVIIQDEMRFRIIVAASSRLGQDLSGKIPDEIGRDCCYCARRDALSHHSDSFQPGSRLGQDL